MALLAGWLAACLLACLLSRTCSLARLLATVFVLKRKRVVSTAIHTYMYITWVYTYIHTYIVHTYMYIAATNDRLLAAVNGVPARALACHYPYFQAPHRPPWLHPPLHACRYYSPRVVPSVPLLPPKVTYGSPWEPLLFTAPARATLQHRVVAFSVEAVAEGNSCGGGMGERRYDIRIYRVDGNRWNKHSGRR